MSPYIILKDKARTSSTSSLAVRKKGNKQQDSSLEDFISYAELLLSKPHRNPTTGLLPPQLSPTASNHSRRGSIIEEPSAKEAIDLAILRGTPSSSSNRSGNRFEVARNGRRVAVLTLGRSAYRLGETIIAVVDFSNAEIPCYALHATLETSERVDPSIALRSGASIYRVTRRTHGSHSESTLFARRVAFSPTIPVTATPEFITSGVSLDWKLKVEFVTPRISGDEEDEGGGAPLLEEVQRDDRGVILAAVEGITCESFEVMVPVRVYGAVVGGAVAKDESASTDGFAV
jgi:RAB6A-GEF complex partner protein 2